MLRMAGGCWINLEKARKEMKAVSVSVGGSPNIIGTVLEIKPDNFFEINDCNEKPRRIDDSYYVFEVRVLSIEHLVCKIGRLQTELKEMEENLEKLKKEYEKK